MKICDQTYYKFKRYRVKLLLWYVVERHENEMSVCIYEKTKLESCFAFSHVGGNLKSIFLTFDCERKQDEFLLLLKFVELAGNDKILWHRENFQVKSRECRFFWLIKHLREIMAIDQYKSVYASCVYSVVGLARSQMMHRYRFDNHDFGGLLIKPTVS